MKKAFLLVAIAIAAYLGYFQYRNLSSRTATEAAPTEVSQADAALAKAFKNHVSNLSVEGQGIVTKILADDNDGRRHQRFILRIGSGQTLLIAHNIDLAPRIGGLREGDAVSFSGTYEWNAQGGVVHWTHRDPSGRHQAGWLKHNGEVFQ
jgi:hypothetical protein